MWVGVEFYTILMKWCKNWCGLEMLLTRDHQLGLFTGTLTPRPSSNDDLSEAFSKILPETDNFPVDFQTSLMSTAMPSFKYPHRPKISSWGKTCLWLLREN